MQTWCTALAWFTVQSGIWKWLHRLGGPGLILVALVDNSVVPIPGGLDVFTVLLSSHQRNWWFYYAAMSSAGAVVGGYITYRLAEKGGEETLERKIGKKKAQEVYQKFEGQGGFWIFFGSILPPPFPMVAVLMAAGVLEYPKKKFLATLALGRSLRYFALAWVGHRYGTAILHWFTRYHQPLLYALIAGAVLGGLGTAVYFAWIRPRLRARHSKNEKQKNQEPLQPSESKIA